MKFDPQNHHRRSIRLKDYDYSQAGAYFITLVTQGRANLFGEIENGVMRLNRYGKIVQRAWMDLPYHYPDVTLEAFVVMPNHIHAIVVLQADDAGKGGSIQVSKSTSIITDPGKFITQDSRQTRPYGKRRYSLSELVRAFKSFSTRRINRIRDTHGISVWQRNYYEHIVRNQAELENIGEYIAGNPQKWATDEENPERPG